MNSNVQNLGTTKGKPCHRLRHRGQKADARPPAALTVLIVAAKPTDNGAKICTTILHTDATHADPEPWAGGEVALVLGSVQVRPPFLKENE